MRKHARSTPFRYAGLPILFCAALTLISAVGAQQPATSGAAAPTAPHTTVAPADAVSPENAPLTEAQGDSFLARGRYVAAIRCYAGAEPKTASIYNKLGIASEHMRMNAQAKESFTKALAIDPKFAEVYNNLGTLAHTEGDFKGAEKLYKKAIKLNANGPDAEKNLGTLYYARGKYNKGDAAYRRAHELDKDIFARSAHAPIQASTESRNTADLHYHLAKTYAKAGSNQLALEYLRKAVGEGFHDRKRLLTEQEFAALWNRPDFMKLVEDLKTN